MNDKRSLLLFFDIKATIKKLLYKIKITITSVTIVTKMKNIALCLCTDESVKLNGYCTFIVFD